MRPRSGGPVEPAHDAGQPGPFRGVHSALGETGLQRSGQLRAAERRAAAGVGGGEVQLGDGGAEPGHRSTDVEGRSMWWGPALEHRRQGRHRQTVGIAAGLTAGADHGGIVARHRPHRVAGGHHSEPRGPQRVGHHHLGVSTVDHAVEEDCVPGAVGGRRGVLRMMFAAPPADPGDPRRDRRHQAVESGRVGQRVPHHRVAAPRADHVGEADHRRRLRADREHRVVQLGRTVVSQRHPDLDQGRTVPVHHIDGDDLGGAQRPATAVSTATAVDPAGERRR